MQIDWTTLSLYIVAAFTFAGFLRGWWKEMFTTAVLALFVFFLKNPEWAKSAIDYLNTIITLVATLVPMSVDTVTKGDTQMVVAMTSSAQAAPYLVDANSPNTWLNLFLLSIAGSILLGRVSSLPNRPTMIGQLFGGVIGLLNGSVITGILREYLDGRALPGGVGMQQQTGDIVLSGSNGIQHASSDLLIKATSLPNITILDSMIPWLVIVTGMLFFFAFVKSRVAIEKSNEGMRLNYRRIPPFYS